MGIESDQLVYDYLSRVGDLAQQRKLPSSDRMRLVSGLREEIQRRRSRADDDSPGAVRRILGGLGAPEEVVATAGGADDRGASARRSDDDRLPPPRSAPEAGVPAGPSPPHLAGTDELAGPGGVPAARTGEAAPDWWRVEVPGFTPGGAGGGPQDGAGALGPGTSVPGFTGGIELPEILKPPPPPEPPDTSAQPAAEAGKDAAPPRTGLLRRLVARRRPAPVAPDAESAPPVPRRVVAPLVLAAAALLLVGAVLGSLIALALGWLLAYGGTRRLSRTEARVAALGLPGAVAGGALVWLWGRWTGRWGEPLPVGQLVDALADTWPVVVRVAAVASALFLLWRAARRPAG